MGAPFDVEYTVGRTARYGGEDAAPYARVTQAGTRALIGPIGGYQIRASRHWYARRVERVIWRAKGHIAVGAYIDCAVDLVVQRIGERQADKGAAIISVVAGVDRSGDDCARADGVVVVRPAGCGGCGWRVGTAAEDVADEAEHLVVLASR